MLWVIERPDRPVAQDVGMPQGLAGPQPSVDAPVADWAPAWRHAPDDALRVRHARTWRAFGHLAVIACYALPAVALWWHAWDGHLSSTLTCTCGDPGQTVWFVAWPAYALAHGLDPFFSRAMDTPAGVNLLSNASSLPVGISLAPVTWTLGPVSATNVALTLSPALSAWACWVACRRFVVWGWAAVVAGGLFGYSPFVVTNLALGHIGLCLLVCPPLLVVAGYELLVGAPGHRVRWGLALGGLVVLQFFISSEILAIVAVVGVPGGALAAIIAARAGRLAPAKELVRALGAATGVVVALLAWPVLDFLYGPQHLRGALWPGAAVDGNPLDALWSAGHYRAPAASLLRLGGYLGHQGPPSSYLGPVVLAAAGLSLAAAWRWRSSWLLALAGVAAAWSSLGAFLSLSAHHVAEIWVPWRVIGGLPLLDDVIPQRFSAVVDLCVALVIGIGLDRARRLAGDARAPRSVARSLGTSRRSRATRFFVALLAASGVLVAASPWWTYQVPFATRTVVVPRWFGAQAHAIAPHAVVLSVPFPFPTDGVSAPMVWQAADDMGFRIAGAYAKVPGPTGRPVAASTAPLVDKVLSSFGAPGSPARGTPRQLAAIRAAIRSWHVDDVVVAAVAYHARRAVTVLRAALGRPPRYRLGAWVWALHPGPGPRGGSTGAGASP